MTRTRAVPTACVCDLDLTDSIDRLNQWLTTTCPNRCRIVFVRLPIELFSSARNSLASSIFVHMCMDVDVCGCVPLSRPNGRSVGQSAGWLATTAAARLSLDDTRNHILTHARMCVLKASMCALLYASFVLYVISFHYMHSLNHRQGKTGVFCRRF